MYYFVARQKEMIMDFRRSRKNSTVFPSWEKMWRTTKTSGFIWTTDWIGDAILIPSTRE